MQKESDSRATTLVGQPDLLPTSQTSEKDLVIETSRVATPSDLEGDKGSRSHSPDVENGPGSNEPEFREGGAIGWATVVGSWCIMFTSFGMTNAFGVYQDYYVRVYLTNYTASQISWIGSTLVFAQLAMGIPAGILFDRGGFYYMNTGGGILCAVCYFMLSLCKPQQYYQIFLAQGLGAGLACGFLYLPGVGVVAHHFKRRRMLVMGIVASGSSFGGIVFPIMLNNLFQIYGFAWATRIVAFTCLGLNLLAISLMRANVQQQREAFKNKNSPKRRSWSLLKDTKYTLAVVGAFFNIQGIFFPIFYLQLFAIRQGISPIIAFYSLTALNAGSAIGRIIPNLLADKYGPTNTIVPCAFACGITCMAVLGIREPAGLYIVAILAGFFSGGYISMLGPLFSNLADHMGEIGIRMGIAFTVVSVGGLIGSPIHGALLTTDYHWERPAAYSLCMLVAGSGFFFGSRQLLVKKRGTWKV